MVQRGNNHQASFFAEQDYRVYLDKLKEYSKKHQVEVHTFVLMTNHMHLLLTPSTEKGVSQLMQSLGRYYVRFVNHTYQRTGSLWEGRHKSTLVDSGSYSLLVSRYIELNPARANMVSHPADYPWSSYHGNALDKKIELLTPHPCYLSLGKTIDLRKECYRALFEQTFAECFLEDIRNATSKAWVLGDNQFRQQIEEQTVRRAGPLKRGGDRKSLVY